MRNTIIIGFLFLSISAYGQDPQGNYINSVQSFEIKPAQKAIEEEIKSLKISDDFLNDSAIRKDDLENGYFMFYTIGTNGGFSETAGLGYNNQVILPMVFSRNSRKYNGISNVVQLGIEGKYGVFNYKSRSWDIPMLYESLSQLQSSNLFMAKKGGVYGIIDSKENILIPFKWNQISEYGKESNYFSVKDGKRKFGVYNLLARKLSIPCVYNEIRKIGSYFKVRTAKGLYNLVDINNNSKFEIWYEDLILPDGGKKRYIVLKDELYGVVDDNENIIVPFEYEEFNDYSFDDGSYLAKNKNGYYGCILLDGTVTLPFIYDDLSQRGSSNNIISEGNGRCGIVQINDGSPKEIATCDYDEIQVSSEGFIIKQNEYYGIMDRYGDIIQEPLWDNIKQIGKSSGRETVGFIAIKDNASTLLNEYGQIAIKKEYRSISLIPKMRSSYRNSSSSFLKVQNSAGKYGVIDKFGSLVLGFDFDEIISEDNKIIIAEKNRKRGMYDLLNATILIDYDYDQLYKVEQGFIGIIGKQYYQISEGPDYNVIQL